MLAKYRHRKNRGASILETPGVLMMIFLGFCMPLIGLCMFTYRASLLYFCVRDAAYVAATSSTFTLAGSNSLTTWNRDIAAWTGITAVGGPKLTIIITKNSTGATSTSQSALAVGSVDTSNNQYFMSTQGTATIQPLLGSGWKLLWMATGIPGLNAPYQLEMSQQVYIENPNGLTQ
jgi:hypothetical protein